VQVWPAHGAGSTCGKALGAVPQTTVGYERLYNASLGAAAEGEEAFVNAILSGQPEPQTYFARMKRDNNHGVPILGPLPQPQKLSVAELEMMVKDESVLVIDTRLDRSGFMARHVPGALYAPMNKSFNTAIGSLVGDETQPILLVIEDAGVKEAVRDLVRIGYDNVKAFATPETLTRYFDQGGVSASIPEITFADVERMKDAEGVEVVDVRFAAEYASAHVPGSISASYTRLPDYERERIPAGKTLLVHCASGARSAVGAAFLARKGHNVRYVNGVFSSYPGETAVDSTQTLAVA